VYDINFQTTIGTSMMRSSLIRRRIERLEAAGKKREVGAFRSAFIEVLAEDCVERHLVMISPSDAQQCCFQERPGPGPQLAAFGAFGMVLYLTTAEMNC
jgi:ribosomal protein L17